MKRYCLEIAGDLACFTRPEMKVERVSYDVITPSAARAVFEAILWKPAIRWHVRRKLVDQWAAQGDVQALGAGLGIYLLTDELRYDVRLGLLPEGRALDAASLVQ